MYARHGVTPGFSTLPRGSIGAVSCGVSLAEQLNILGPIETPGANGTGSIGAGRDFEDLRLRTPTEIQRWPIPVRPRAHADLDAHIGENYHSHHGAEWTLVVGQT